MQSLLAELTVHDDVVAHVAGLRADGYRTALVTNNVREGSATWRAMIPVDDLFDVVVDSSAVGMRKPDPAIFTHTLDLLGGIAPDRAVFLDDVEGNLVGARLAGLHTILVERPARPRAGRARPPARPVRSGGLTAAAHPPSCPRPPSRCRGRPGRRRPRRPAPAGGPTWPWSWPRSSSAPRSSWCRTRSRTPTPCRSSPSAS